MKIEKTNEMQFKDRLRTLREMSGLTQSELARKAARGDWKHVVDTETTEQAT